MAEPKRPTGHATRRTPDERTALAKMDASTIAAGRRFWLDHAPAGRKWLIDAERKAEVAAVSSGTQVGRIHSLRSEWPGIMAGDVAPTKSRYAWLTKSRVFEKIDTGARLAVARVRSAVESVVSQGEQLAKQLSKALVSARIDIPTWQGRMESLIKQVHAATGLIGGGGAVAITDPELKAVEAKVEHQLEFLEAFAVAVEEGLALDGKIPPRAAQYLTAAIGTFEGSRRVGDTSEGWEFERRIINSNIPCFPAGTLIETSDGSVPIQDVRPGDLVLTRFGYRRVTTLFVSEHKGHLLSVSAGERSVVSTPNHPFLTGRGWVCADALVSGDQAVILETGLDGFVGHVAVPYPDNGIAARGQVFVAGGVFDSLSGLPRKQRLETRVTVPPFAVSFDDECADPEIDNKVILDADLTFVDEAQGVQDGCEADFQLGRLGFHHVVMSVQEFLPEIRVLPKLFSDRSSNPFGSAGPVGRVIVDHSLNAGLPANSSSGFSGQINPEKTRLVSDGVGRSVQEIRHPDTAVVGVELTEVLEVGFGPNAYGLLRKGTLPAEVGDLGFLSVAPGADVAHRGLAHPTPLTDQSDPLAFLSALSTDGFSGSFLGTPGTTAKAERFGTHAVMPASGANFPSLVSLSLGIVHRTSLYPDPCLVYNLEVEDVHEYIANGFVVHNCNECQDYADEGWQPALILPDIGESCSCNSRCMCSWERSMTQPADMVKPAPKRQAPPQRKAPAPGTPSPAPATPESEPDPAHPMAKKLRDYTEGDAKVAAIKAAGELHAAKKANLDRITAKITELFDEESALRKSAPGSPAHVEAEKQLAEYRRAYGDAAHFEEKTRKATVEKVREILKSETPLGFTGPKGKDVVIPKGMTEIDEGLKFMQSITGRGTASGPAAVSFKSIAASARAEYDDGKVRVSRDSPAAVVAHEIGHLLEDVVPGWGKAAVEFLGYRTAGEPLAQFRDVLGSNYGTNEVGRRDKFGAAFGADAYYVGKEYKVGHYILASEITSMGVQKLMHDPVGFAHADPEYLKMILGLLDGKLR